MIEPLLFGILTLSIFISLVSENFILRALALKISGDIAAALVVGFVGAKDDGNLTLIAMSIVVTVTSLGMLMATIGFRRAKLNAN